jgi:hypothetical protein
LANEFLSKMASQTSLVMKKLLAFMMLAMLTVVFISCEKDQLQSVTPQLEQYTAPATGEIEFRGKDCFNFRTNFSGCFGPVSLTFDGLRDVAEGVGAMPANATVGVYEGHVASVIEKITQPGYPNGATHFVLVHKFWTEDGDFFYTEDKAVCSTDPSLDGNCMINDQMTIVGGTGVFANVSGKIKTHGLFTSPASCSELGSFGTLELELHGHICLN